MKRILLALGLFYFTAFNHYDNTETTTVDMEYTTTTGKIYKFKRVYTWSTKAENLYPEEFSRLDMLKCDTLQDFESLDVAEDEISA